MDLGQGVRCVSQPDHPLLGARNCSGSQGVRGRRIVPGMLVG